jgi:hypothetical protein
MHCDDGTGDGGALRHSSYRFPGAALLAVDDAAFEHALRFLRTGGRRQRGQLLRGGVRCRGRVLPGRGQVWRKWRMREQVGQWVGPSRPERQVAGGCSGGAALARGNELRGYVDGLHDGCASASGPCSVTPPVALTAATAVALHNLRLGLMDTQAEAATDFLTMDLAEMLVFDRALTTSELDRYFPRPPCLVNPMHWHAVLRAHTRRPHIRSHVLSRAQAPLEDHFITRGAEYSFDTKG